MVNLKSTREGYGDALSEIGFDNKIVVLSADLTESNKLGKFAKENPNRFFQCGVAEQNMVGMAAGLALSGKTPFVSSFAAFIPGRVLDQVRIDACYNNLNIKFASTHAGLTVGEDGATHQALEDIATMRVLPNMTVIVPCDYEETKKAVKQAAQLKGPVYIRLGRDKLPVITGRSTPFHIGRSEIFKKGSDVTIIACGVMVNQALKAAEELYSHGVDAEVMNCHTIKPLDNHKIIDSVKKTGCVVVAEEHQMIGGLGGAIAELLASHRPVPIEFVAVKDSFGESGKSEELMNKYGLTSKEIVHAANKVVKRKK